MNIDQSLISEFFTRILGPLSTTPISKLMVEPDNMEERVQLLAETFHAAPHLILPFRALIKSLHTTEDEVVLEEQIRFFTTKHTRNWLIVNLMNDVLKIKDLELDHATGRLPNKAHTLIKYAIQARNELGEDGRYKDLAFAAGLIFDYLFYLQRTPLVHLEELRFDEPINECFRIALEQSKLILKLDRHKSKLSLEKLSPVIPFMRQITQISLVFLRPKTAPEFYRKLLALKPTEAVRQAHELREFKVHSGILSAYFSQIFPVFDRLGEGMSVLAFPYLSWVSGRREIHDLAGMGLLGIVINERLTVADFPDGALIGNVIPELEYLSILVNLELKAEMK